MELSWSTSSRSHSNKPFPSACSIGTDGTFPPDAAAELFGTSLDVGCLYLRGWREEGAARLKKFPAWPCVSDE